jgi:phosphatidylserine/phosphatidylglycerophosphate/cardiolipin synthase-like enzyme
LSPSSARPGTASGLAAYGFTSKPIAAALVEAHWHGLDVRVVIDKSNATARDSAARFLVKAGIPVRIDYQYRIMHDKFIEVDGETVETGSFISPGRTFQCGERRGPRAHGSA